MSFGERLRTRREELALSRAELAEKLGVTRSAIGNYETGVSFPKEDILLRLFDCLQVDPNYLYGDSFRSTSQRLTHQEQRLLEQERYRSLYDAMKRLPANQCEMIYLVYFEDMNVTQAASVIRKTQRQGNSILFRARQNLKAILEKEGFEYENKS